MALVTQFIPSGSVHPDENDATGIVLTRVKPISNKGNGLTECAAPMIPLFRNIVANNGGWGIDVLHKDDHYSGRRADANQHYLYANGAMV